MVDAREANDLPWPLRRVMAALGFTYLSLRTVPPHPATVTLLERESFEADPSRRTYEATMDRDEVLSVG